MCTLTHFAMTADDRIKSPLILSATDFNDHCPRFQVVPAGNAFFHIKETSTGRVRGFREDHNEACALARSLESKIELLANGCLR
ncbi:hypothetical protein PS619_05041 [Pseudomonas fluorescens]|uniref:Uncharacterized protein n=1 Tax=Pseudomonas tensinigenes TaxID=2745511 RepID=A0ABX8Q577_9PSED|nr:MULTISPECIES: hypothetical protein [Pseudomonas]QXI08473.1 hypothetical protein HU718_012450 [Pseudomonas tensinigenes]VVN25158.1 hypothetical protein PS681_04539 [Pseudomonas fluorescens]VVN35014.1 hypothetical protein PS619_05041 [Pseudomonas fluorescens]VVN55105.1 hypothetical protein PS684_01974 [Pseudomonas fluorescens]